jgi:hypothetical protein
MGKESFSRSVSPEESGVAPLKFNPVASCFRNQWRDLSLRNSRGDWTPLELFVAGVRAGDHGGGGNSKTASRPEFGSCDGTSSGNLVPKNYCPSPAGIS